MSRFLITGVEGFTGRYLAAELHSAGHEVFGIAHLHLADITGVSKVFPCDLCDAEGLAKVVAEVQPDCVAHLAAIAFVGHGDVEAIYRTNVVGTRNLLEALVKSPLLPKSVLLASSANVYGNSTEGVLDEVVAPAPANDYAVSKLAMEYVARLYGERLPIIIARPFNYTGVGQAESFLLPKIVNHVRRRESVLELGNLEVSRDFSDVRMVVRYYRLLLECPAAIGQTFNVCSGKPYTLREVLEIVRSVSQHKFDVRINPAFVRANEVKVLVGNRSRLESVVGNVPVIPLIDTLRWMLEADV